jgi:hypothetical protein
MTDTPLTERQTAVAEATEAWMRAGWAMPTSFEYQSVCAINEMTEMARKALVRQAHVIEPDRLLAEVRVALANLEAIAQGWDNDAANWRDLGDQMMASATEARARQYRHAATIVADAVNRATS